MVETTNLSGLRVDEILAEFFSRRLEEKDKLPKQSRAKKSKLDDSNSTETETGEKEQKEKKHKKKKKHKHHKKRHKKEKRHQNVNSEKEIKSKKHKKSKRKSKKRRHSESPSENESEKHNKKLKIDKLLAENEDSDKFCDEDHDPDKCSKTLSEKRSCLGISLDKLDYETSTGDSCTNTTVERKLPFSEERELKNEKPGMIMLHRSEVLEKKSESGIIKSDTTLANHNDKELTEDNVKNYIPLKKYPNDAYNDKTQDTSVFDLIFSGEKETVQNVNSPVVTKPKQTENDMSLSKNNTTKLFVNESILPEKIVQTTETNTPPLESSNFYSYTNEKKLKCKNKIIIKDLKFSQIVQVLQEKERCKSADKTTTAVTEELKEGCSKLDIVENAEDSLNFDSESQEKTFETNIVKKKKKKSKHKHKHKKRKEKDRSRSRSLDREVKRKHGNKDRHSKSPIPKRLEIHDTREKIDKARLLEIARKNLLTMIEKGTLPKGINVDILKQEQLVSIKSGGKSVEELTEFCRTLSQKEKECSDDDINTNQDDDSEHPFIHHPFKLRDPQPIIKLNIKNAVQLPIKTHAEKAADAARLRLQFPVSSGSQHRQKELEWIPVEKTNKGSESAAKESEPQPKQTRTNTKSKSHKKEILAIEGANNSREVPDSKTAVIAAPPAHKKPAACSITPALPAKQEPQPIITNQNAVDVTSIIAQRVQAIQKLQENPNDLEALNNLYTAEQQIHLWAQSKKLPGQYTGNTDVRLLTVEELSGPTPVWVKKDQFFRAAPLREGIGMSLLKKMGWNPGEGLGKNKEGTLEPLLLDIKTDKRGLVSEGETAKKALIPPAVQGLGGKHPVSALQELCSKRKWTCPVFSVINESGPSHRKCYLFRVRVNNVDYQPPTSIANKKQAKALAATVCLQALGILPKNFTNLPQNT